jgi:hypothetical protein
VQDNPARFSYDVAKFVDLIKTRARKQKLDFPAGEAHILWTCGMDFNFKNAFVWYHNLDVLMHHVNKDPEFNMLYSTPANYVDSKHKSMNFPESQLRSTGKSIVPKKKKLRLIPGDLLPLHATTNSYWNGYYASRVPFKRLVRHSFAVLQSAQQIESFTFGGKYPERKEERPYRREPIVGSLSTDGLEGALSLSMHHDAITGTSKQAVNNDYAQRISETFPALVDGMSAGINQLLSSKVEPGKRLNWSMCFRLNISFCEVTAEMKDSFSVVAWNPLAQPLGGYIL